MKRKTELLIPQTWKLSSIEQHCLYFEKKEEKENKITSLSIWHPRAAGTSGQLFRKYLKNKTRLIGFLYFKF